MVKHAILGYNTDYTSNEMFVNKAKNQCTRPIPRCPPPYVGIIDATSRATTDGANNKLARTHSLFFMDVANIPVSLEIDSSLWLANSPCEAAQATRDLAFASSGQISAT